MLKSTTHLYRDCLRTIEHMNGRSAKGRHIAAIVRQQFKDNKHITEEGQIETLRKKYNTPHAAHCHTPAPLSVDGADVWLVCGGVVWWCATVL